MQEGGLSGRGGACKECHRVRKAEGNRESQQGRGSPGCVKIPLGPRGDGLEGARLEAGRLERRRGPGVRKTGEV